MDRPGGNDVQTKAITVADDNDGVSFTVWEPTDTDRTYSIERSVDR